MNKLTTLISSVKDSIKHKMYQWQGDKEAALRIAFRKGLSQTRNHATA